MARGQQRNVNRNEMGKRPNGLGRCQAHPRSAQAEPEAFVPSQRGAVLKPAERFGGKPSEPKLQRAKMAAPSLPRTCSAFATACNSLQLLATPCNSCSRCTGKRPDPLRCTRPGRVERPDIDMKAQDFLAKVSALTLRSYALGLFTGHRGHQADHHSVRQIFTQ